MPPFNVNIFIIFFTLLYLIATPIGNLADITFRAIETLQSCDYILCEDTRHSVRLLQHYNLDNKKLRSYHKFNETSQSAGIVEDLKAGKDIALITDAGTPCISDPGYRLVEKCHQAEVKVFGIPGPCAAIQALACSGLDTSRFQFLGFLPKKSQALEYTIIEALLYPGITACYESPNRLLATLEKLEKLAPEGLVVVCRELTKKFEEIRRDNSQNQYQYWKEKKSIKGEITLVIEGCHSKIWESKSPEEQVQKLERLYSISRKDAIKIIAKIRGIPGSNIYKVLNRSAEC